VTEFYDLSTTMLAIICDCFALINDNSGNDTLQFLLWYSWCTASGRFRCLVSENSRISFSFVQPVDSVMDYDDYFAGYFLDIVFNVFW